LHHATHPRIVGGVKQLTICPEPPMTPRDIPGSLGLEWLEPWFAALRDAGTPQAPRAAAQGEDRTDEPLEAVPARRDRWVAAA
jgi:hypothetical protein